MRWKYKLLWMAVGFLLVEGRNAYGGLSCPRWVETAGEVFRFSEYNSGALLAQEREIGWAIEREAAEVLGEEPPNSTEASFDEVIHRSRANHFVDFGSLQNYLLNLVYSRHPLGVHSSETKLRQLRDGEESAGIVVIAAPRPRDYAAIVHRLELPQYAEMPRLILTESKILRAPSHRALLAQGTLAWLPTDPPDPEILPPSGEKIDALEAIRRRALIANAGLSRRSSPKSQLPDDPFYLRPNTQTFHLIYGLPSTAASALASLLSYAWLRRPHLVVQVHTRLSVDYAPSPPRKGPVKMVRWNPLIQKVATSAPAQEHLIRIAVAFLECTSYEIAEKKLSWTPTGEPAVELSVLGGASVKFVFSD